jgi:hypothetical protein
MAVETRRLGRSAGMRKGKSAGMRKGRSAGRRRGRSASSVNSTKARDSFLGGFCLLRVG